MKQSHRLLFSKRDRWVRPYFKKYKFLLFLVLVMGFLTFFCGSALMFTSGYLISRSATRPANILLVYIPIVLTRAFGIGRPVFRYVERLLSHNWVLRMTSDLRLRLYRALERNPEQQRAGNVMGLVAEDIEHIQNLYLRTLFPTLISWLLSIVATLALGFFSFKMAFLMGLLCLLATFLLPLVAFLWNRARMYRRKAARHQLYQDMTDTILGVGDWQYSRREADFYAHYDLAEQASRLEDRKIKGHVRLQMLLLQLIFGLMALALFFWSAHYTAAYGQSGLNWVAAFVLAIFPLTDAFGPVLQAVMELPNYEDTAQHLNQFADDGQALQAPQEVRLPKTADIQFQQVDFRYAATQRALLDNFSLEIPAGQLVALLGKSGTGKTTLSRLLMGELTPDRGVIQVGNVPVAEWAEDHAAVIGVLNQFPHLFDTSIYNNIHLANLEASPEEVERAVEQAGLKDLVASLPAGLQTSVEEGGQRFSGGEQQRIALARILLQDVPIVIIDEPTIGLDPVTERKLLETVFQALKGKTIIWITHHLVGLHHADQVVFLEDGRIKMQGAPAELAAGNQYFQQLKKMDEIG